MSKRKNSKIVNVKLPKIALYAPCSTGSLISITEEVKFDFKSNSPKNWKKVIIEIAKHLTKTKTESISILGVTFTVFKINKSKIKLQIV